MLKCNIIIMSNMLFVQHFLFFSTEPTFANKIKTLKLAQINKYLCAIIKRRRRWSFSIVKYFIIILIFFFIIICARSMKTIFFYYCLVVVSFFTSVLLNMTLKSFVSFGVEFYVVIFQTTWIFCQENNGFNILTFCFVLINKTRKTNEGEALSEIRIYFYF